MADAQSAGISRHCLCDPQGAGSSVSTTIGQQMARPVPLDAICVSSARLLFSQRCQGSRTTPKTLGYRPCRPCGQALIHNPFGVINADDYYGKSSLQLLADDLRQMSATGRRYLLVSFPLGKTLSPCGTVSRGVVW